MTRSTKDDKEDFHRWYTALKNEWYEFKREEGSMITFGEYLAARERFREEIKNG